MFHEEHTGHFLSAESSRGSGLASEIFPPRVVVSRTAGSRQRPLFRLLKTGIRRCQVDRGEFRRSPCMERRPTSLAAETLGDGAPMERGLSRCTRWRDLFADPRTAGVARCDLRRCAGRCRATIPLHLAPSGSHGPRGNAARIPLTTHSMETCLRRSGSDNPDQSRERKPPGSWRRRPGCEVIDRSAVRARPGSTGNRSAVRPHVSTWPPRGWASTVRPH